MKTEKGRLKVGVLQARKIGKVRVTRSGGTRSMCILQLFKCHTNVELQHSSVSIENNIFMALPEVIRNLPTYPPTCQVLAIYTAETDEFKVVIDGAHFRRILRRN